MNKLNIHRYTKAFAALVMGLSLMGCAEEESLTNNGGVQLSVTPVIKDNEISRAANTASDTSLNEDKLTKLNIKMLGEYDECKVDKTLASNLQNNTAVVIAQNNWKVDNDLQEGKTYVVKTVANATGDGDTQTDTDIWKPVSSNFSSKTFLMSATQNYTITQEPTQTIPVELTRAAAKITVTVKVAVDGYTPGQAKWCLKNYNAKTTVFGTDNTESDIQEGEWTEAQGGSGTYTLTTYSYATTWTDADNAPAVYLQIPLTSTSDEKTEMNYYRVPVRDPESTAADAKSLARNTIYDITANITSKGGSSDIKYITAGSIEYAVMPWSESDQTNIDANVAYLMVYPQTVYMNNVTDDNSVTFRSSSTVSIESIKAYYIDNEGNTIEYTNKDYTEYHISGYKKEKQRKWGWNGWKWEQQEVEVETDPIYGTEFKPYPSVNLSATDALSGNITLSSPLPLNRFAKYIVVTLKNAEGKTATVKYKQSPLIEAGNYIGWYSSGSAAGWVSHQNQNSTDCSTWEGTKYNYDGSYQHNNYYGYPAKYYKDGKIYYFYNNEPAGKNNNRMYIIQVTSTKDSKYRIAHATKNADGYTTDEVVSPAFMIGSQLGMVYSVMFDQDKAKTHCETYREVSTNGTIYDGWRLPTKTEIQFIVDFQKESYKDNSNNEKKPIQYVLQGQKYYTLNNESVATGYTGSNYAEGTFVRCVRDLTTDEVDALNKEMK